MLTRVTAAQDAEMPLAGQPTIIEPVRGWIAIPWRELWERRELFWMLAGRDLRIRYKQTVLGIVWSILQPLLSMVMFWVFFGRLAGMPSQGLPYPLFALLALVPWTLFASAVTHSANSLVANGALLTKVYMPRLLLPAAAVLVAVADALVPLGVLLTMMLGYRVPVRLELLLVAPLLLLVATFALGCGLVLAAANAKYRDVRYLVPVALQVAMFVSPIIYPSTLVPMHWRSVYALNPLSGAIDALRAIARGAAIPWSNLALGTVTTTLLLALGLAVFQRFEQHLTDTL